METSIKLTTKVSCFNFTFGKFSFLSNIGWGGAKRVRWGKAGHWNLYWYAKNWGTYDDKINIFTFPLE